MTTEPSKNDTSPPQLEAEPELPSFLRPWFIALLGAFVGYPLSVAPVAWVCQKVDPNGTWTEYIRMGYLPLKFLYDTLPPVRLFYDWYLGLFGVR